MLILLARGLQGAGRHDEALDLFGLALESAPALGRDKAVRREIATAEKRLGRTSSILPPPKSRRGAIAAVAGIVVLVLAGFLLWNRHLATHQTLHVVNGLPARIEVIIDGGEPLAVEPGVRRTVTVAERDHEAVVGAEGAADRRIAFRIENSFGQRFSSRKSVFVLNPGGAATLLWNRITYSADPGPVDPADPHRLDFGREFSTYREVDHPSRSPPGRSWERESPRGGRSCRWWRRGPRTSCPSSPTGRPRPGCSSSASST